MSFICLQIFTLKNEKLGRNCQIIPTSFPGSLFFFSLERKKRDPGNEVGSCRYRLTNAISEWIGKTGKYLSFILSTYRLLDIFCILFPSPFSCIRITTIFCQLLFNVFFTTGCQFQYNTRTAFQYRSHLCRTDIKRFSILYRGPKVWNSLPVTIVSFRSISIFEKKSETISWKDN